MKTISRAQVKSATAALLLGLAVQVTAQAQDTIFDSSFEAGFLNHLDPALSSDWWSYGGDVVEGDTLRTLAITPYGAWFQHVSDSTTASGYRPTVYWSTQPFSSSGQAQGSDEWVYRESQSPGRWSEPHFITELQPDTTYYVRVGRRSSLTDMIEIRTRPLDTTRNINFAVSPQTLTELQSAYQAGEMDRWLPIYRSRLALNDGNYSARFAFAAALLYRITGSGSDFSNAINRWEDALGERSGVVTRNAYRWASGHLALSTALLWNDLSSSQRLEALNTLIDDDEASDNVDPPYADTDRHLAATHIQLFSGFLATAPGVPSNLRSRFDVVYQRALRNWEGIYKPKMRTSRHKWALSGGSMDDGTDYGVGTAEHWLETFWAYEQMGDADMRYYSPWVRNHIRQKIHLILPNGSVRFSYSDVESGDITNNGSTYRDDWSNNFLLVHLAQQAGFSAEAQHLTQVMSQFNRNPNNDTVIGGFELLERSANQGSGRIPLTMVDSGVGLVFSRTAWTTSADAIMVMFGWRGVHHQQNDAGHISWWSNGGWRLYEVPDYGLTAGAHNTPEGQFHWGLAENGYSAMIGAADNSQNLELTLDLTDAYRNTNDQVFPFDSVVRSINWDKNGDVLQVIDRFEGAPGATTNWIGPANVTRTNVQGGFQYQIR